MVDVIDEIKESIEEGIEAVEEVVEEVAAKIVPKKVSKKDLAKEAEKESTDPKVEKTLEEKKKALLEKVKKLKGKVDETTTEDLKAQVKAKKKADMLIPLEEYVKVGIYLGTRVVTPSMKKYVYRRRADGIAIFNTDIIDEKLKEGIDYLCKFNPEDVILCCKRQAGWKAAEMFGKLTGIRVFAKKYPAGILTNTQLEDFFENELTIVTDAWLDKNALKDTLNVKKKVLMICDTNNFSKGADQIIIGNNKSAKSLGVIFYLLTRGYMRAKDMDTTKIPDMDWWIEETDEVKRAKKRKLRIVARAGARFGV
jgi:small subunit ribosomal protein S2